MISLILFAGMVLHAADGATISAPRPLASRIVLSANSKPFATIVYGRESKAVAEFIRREILQKSGVKLSLLADTDKKITDFRQNLIVLGNLATNQACDYLYRNLYTYEDRYFPGGKGYVVRTLLNPLGKGSNIVVLGGSTPAGVKKAAEIFIKTLVKQNGKLFIKPQLLVKWGKDFKGTNYFPYRMTAGRGPLQAAVKYLRTGDKKYAEQYKKDLFKYYKRPNHLFSYYSSMLWDVMEASGAFSDAERLQVVNKELKFMRGSEGYNFFFFNYYKPEGHRRKPKEFYNRVLGNHVTRAGMGFYFGYRYFDKYYQGQVPKSELKKWSSLRDSLWSSFFKSYRNLDESYSQHGFGGSLDNTLVVGLAEPELSKVFFKQKLGRKMADYVFTHVNNMGKMPVVGDGGGIYGPSNLFSKLAYAYNDGRYLYMAQKTGNGAISTDEPIRGFVTDLKPVVPREYLGAFAVKPHSIWPANPEADSFDKLSFRGGFNVLDSYLLIDGRGGLSHSYMDQNTIAEYSQNAQVWVCQPDEFSYLGLADHNAVSYYYNGLAPQKFPLQAKLANLANSKNFSYSHTYLPDYGNATWHRHVLSFKGRKPFAVIDLLVPKAPGNYRVNFNWHFLGNGKVKGQNSYYGQRIAGKRETGFFLTYPAPTDGIFEYKEPKRKKFMEKRYILPSELKFISLVLSKKSTSTSPVGMLTLLSAWRIHKSVTPTVKQIDQTSYIIKFDNQSFYIAMPLPGKRIYNNGKIKVTANFVAFSDKIMFLVNATQVTIGNQEVFKSEKAFTGEIAVSDLKLDKLFVGSTMSQTVSSPVSNLLTVGKTIKSLRIKSGTKLLKTKSGFIIGSANGTLVRFDAKLQKLNSFKTESEILSLISSNDKGILAGTASGKLYCLDANLNLQWQVSIPQCNRQALWYSLGGPKVKTLFTSEFSGKPMIFAGMGDETLQAISNDGKLLWNQLLRWGIPCEVIAGNFRGKGKELIAGTGIISPTPEMYIVTPAGKVISKSRVQNSGAGTGITLLKKIGGKLLAGTSRGTLGLYKINKDRPETRGYIHKIWDINLGRRLTGAVVVSQAGKKIIVAISNSGFVNAFDMQGRQLWFTDLNSSIKLIKPIPGENKLIAATLKKIFILTLQGKVLASQGLPEKVIDFSITQTNGNIFTTILTRNNITQLQLTINRK
jgi:outer membrane protein assembly factor BamB